MVKRYVARRDEWTGEDLVDEHPEGEYVEYADYAALQAENERLKSEAGYAAADVATAAADGFRDGVRSVDMGQFRDAVEKAMHECVTLGFEDYCRNLLALIDAHKGE